LIGPDEEGEDFLSAAAFIRSPDEEDAASREVT
jgi:hypothetical protein